jgi:hypothetical protein
MADAVLRRSGHCFLDETQVDIATETQGVFLPDTFLVDAKPRIVRRLTPIAGGTGGTEVALRFRPRTTGGSACPA